MLQPKCTDYFKWTHKQDPYMSVYRNATLDLRTLLTLKKKKMEEYIACIWEAKKAGVTIFIFRQSRPSNKDARNKEKHCL